MTNFPVMITLNEIRGQNPCTKGWGKVLIANGGFYADLHRSFPLSSILDSNGLEDTVWVLRCKPEHEIYWTKLAVVFADHIKHLIEPEYWHLIDLSWGAACGNISADVLSFHRDRVSAYPTLTSYIAYNVARFPSAIYVWSVLVDVCAYDEALRPVFTEIVRDLLTTGNIERPVLKGAK